MENRIANYIIKLDTTNVIYDDYIDDLYNEETLDVYAKNYSIYRGVTTDLAYYCKDDIVIFYDSFITKLSFVVASLSANFKPHTVNMKDWINNVILPEVQTILPNLKSFNVDLDNIDDDYNNYSEKSFDDFIGVINGPNILADFLKDYNMTIADFLKDNSIVVICIDNCFGDIIKQLCDSGLWSTANIEYIYPTRCW